MVHFSTSKVQEYFARSISKKAWSNSILQGPNDFQQGPFQKKQSPRAFCKVQMHFAKSKPVNTRVFKIAFLLKLLHYTPFLWVTLFLLYKSGCNNVTIYSQSFSIPKKSCFSKVCIFDKK